MNAASQLYMAGLGHLVLVSNGQLLHECSIPVDRLEGVRGSILTECKGFLAILYIWFSCR